MATATTASTGPRGGVRTVRGALRLKQVFFHPELYRLIKSAAVVREVTTADVLHEILCRHFRRPDLRDLGDD